MVVGNMNECFTSRAWSIGGISSFDRMQEGMGQTLTRWNQHNMSSYEIWGGWRTLEELWLEVPRKEMCEERKKEIIKYATMEEAINIQGLKYLTMISPWKIWRPWWTL